MTTPDNYDSYVDVADHNDAPKTVVVEFWMLTALTFVAGAAAGAAAWLWYVN